MGAPNGNKFAIGNKGGGRPPKYHVNYAKLAALAYKSGHIDQEVAELLGISVVTLHKWNSKHHEFNEDRKSGKAPADERVIESLYNRAWASCAMAGISPPTLSPASSGSKTAVLTNGAIARTSAIHSFRTIAPRLRSLPIYSARWPKWVWISCRVMTAASV